MWNLSNDPDTHEQKNWVVEYEPKEIDFIDFDLKVIWNCWHASRTHAQTHTQYPSIRQGYNIQIGGGHFRKKTINDSYTHAHTVNDLFITMTKQILVENRSQKNMDNGQIFFHFYLQFGYFNILREFLLETDNIVLGIWYIYLYKITHDCYGIVRQLKVFNSVFSFLTHSLARIHFHLCTAPLVLLAYSHYDGRLLFASDMWMEYDFIRCGYSVLLLMFLTWQRLSSDDWIAMKLATVQLWCTHKYSVDGVCIGMHVCVYASLLLLYLFELTM